MHIRATVEPTDLRLVSALIVVVADMARLVKIVDAVEQEATREPTLLDGLALVLHDLAELVDLVHDAAMF
jgi:hypothetical protein